MSISQDIKRSLTNYLWDHTLTLTTFSNFLEPAHLCLCNFVCVQLSTLLLSHCSKSLLVLLCIIIVVVKLKKSNCCLLSSLHTLIAQLALKSGLNFPTTFTELPMPLPCISLNLKRSPNVLQCMLRLHKLHGQVRLSLRPGGHAQPDCR